MTKQHYSYHFTILILSFFFLATACGDGNNQEGDLLYDSGNYAEAVKYYNSYLAGRPNDMIVRYNRGRAYEQLDSLAQAEADFKFVTDKEETNTQAYISLGTVQYKQENFSMAILSFERALKYGGQDANVYYLRGLSYLRTGRAELAESDLNKAIALNPQKGSAYYGRAILRIAQKKRRGACADLRKALALGEENAEAQIAKHCK